MRAAGEKLPIMTKTTRFFKKFITFILTGAVLVSSTAFAFADDEWSLTPSIGTSEGYNSVVPVDGTEHRYTVTVTGNRFYEKNSYGYVQFRQNGFYNQSGNNYYRSGVRYEFICAFYPHTMGNAVIGGIEPISGFNSMSLNGVEGYTFGLQENEPCAYAKISFVGNGNNPATYFWIMSRGTSSNRTQFDIEILSYKSYNNETDELLHDYLDNYHTEPITYSSYKFNVPSGQMLHILADNIQSVTVKYNMGFGLFRSSSLTMNANRYNYSLSDYASTQAFGTSNIIQWSKINNSTYQMEIPHDNSNALNFYNFMIGDTERANNYEVYITCSTYQASMYAQDWKGAIEEKTTTIGGYYFGGGTGSVDNPYDVYLYDKDGGIYKPSSLSVDTSAQDGAMQAIVNALSMPGKFIQTVQDSTGEFMKTISTLYSWLPVELTSVIVGAFSVIIAVGVLKMFL